MEGRIMRENARKRRDIFSLRAGRRTYFFDVRATKQMIIILQLRRAKNSLKKTDRFTSKKHKIYFIQRRFSAGNSW
jgi:hypothetical protein